MTGPRVIDWEAEYERQRGGQSAAPDAAGSVDWEKEFEREQRTTLPALPPAVVTANPPALDAGVLPPAVVSDTAATPRPNRYLTRLTSRPLPSVAPGVRPVLPEATRVGTDPYAGHYQPGVIERGLTLPLRMAAEAGEHPIDFAAGLVTAPVKAAITANRAASEQEAANAKAPTPHGPLNFLRPPSTPLKPPRRRHLQRSQARRHPGRPAAAQAGER